MPTTTSYSHASARPSLGKPRKGALLMLTCIGALDGTVMMLAATGRLASLEAALIVGLTVVSGTGAWIAARSAFAEGITLSGYVQVGAIAAISIAATVGAAWLGASLGQALTLHIMPKIAGIVLVLIAAEVGGVNMPRLHHAPLPLVVALSGLLLEGVYWIP